MRDADARQASALGASYAGVILAGGPRQLSPERGAALLALVERPMRRVAVFGDRPVAEVAATGRTMGLDVLQLHADPTPTNVARLRETTGLEVWAVVRVAGGDEAAEQVRALDGVADVILLDALVAGRMGGAGVRFDWRALPAAARPRRSALAVAGGLTPENVGEAMAALGPDIVDVSSGVERERGVKDHDRMRAFVDAVHHHDGQP